MKSYSNYGMAKYHQRRHFMNKKNKIIAWTYQTFMFWVVKKLLNPGNYEEWRLLQWQRRYWTLQASEDTDSLLVLRRWCFSSHLMISHDNLFLTDDQVTDTRKREQSRAWSLINTVDTPRQLPPTLPPIILQTLQHEIIHTKLKFLFSF